MLRLLQSIFGSDKQGSYPESLVKEAIERAVDGTDPWIRAVSGYKKKLRPAVICAIDHVVALVDALPPPIPVRFESYGDDLRLKSFFISAMDMKKFFREDRTLSEFMKGHENGPPQIIALLGMERQEKVISGAELSGDIVIRDVPQVMVSFEAHRLIDPSADEGETRRNLKRRAYDHLLSLALKRIVSVKSERNDLERWRALMQAKIKLLDKEGLGFDKADASAKNDVAEEEKLLGKIEAQLQELGGDDRMLEAYLEIVADVLGRPEQHIVAKSETIFVNRMGIKRSEAASDATELTFNELYNAEGRSMVVMLVSLQGEEVRTL